MTSDVSFGSHGDEDDAIWEELTDSKAEIVCCTVSSKPRRKTMDKAELFLVIATTAHASPREYESSQGVMDDNRAINSAWTRDDTKPATNGVVLPNAISNSSVLMSCN
ncbi:hypothetical protein Bbelb_095930 [Branchiostoma belcheri]|nr:hypothetical protein Bbelb_095930 [Branchiostoma belcheri]